MKTRQELNAIKKDRKKQQPKKTREERLLMKEARRSKMVPAPREYVMTHNVKGVKVSCPVRVEWTRDSICFRTMLPVSGREVQAKFIFGIEEVERKVRLLYGQARVGTLAPGVIFPDSGFARTKDGKPIIIRVAMPATTLTITFQDGTTVQCRSVCKQPDPWNMQEGIKFALRHLFGTRTDNTVRKATEKKVAKLTGAALDEAKRQLKSMEMHRQPIQGNFADRDDILALMKVCLTTPPKPSQIIRNQAQQTVARIRSDYRRLAPNSPADIVRTEVISRLQSATEITDRVRQVAIRLAGKIAE